MPLTYPVEIVKKNINKLYLLKIVSKLPNIPKRQKPNLRHPSIYNGEDSKILNLDSNIFLKDKNIKPFFVYIVFYFHKFNKELHFIYNQTQIVISLV